MALGSFLLCPLCCSCKGCITHQPVTCCDPIDECDHKVYVWNFIKILCNEVQPVVDAPHSMDVGTNSLSRATFSVDYFNHFIGHSRVLANHVFGPISCDGDHLCEIAIFMCSFSKTKFAKSRPVFFRNLVKEDDLLENAFLKPKPTHAGHEMV